MKKSIIMILAVAMAAICAQAATWKDPDTGYTWTYTVMNGAVSVGGESSSSTAVPSSTSGAIVIPSELGGYPVTSIGDGAFYGCSGLTSVTIPDSVTSIGYGAFYGCTGLTAVYITDLAKWCGFSFNGYSCCASPLFDNPLYYAKKLYLNGSLVVNLIIPDNVTSIGNYTFCNCGGLTSVTIGNGVTSIGDRAFSGCSGLTSVTISDSVTIIGSGAFDGCNGALFDTATIPGVKLVDGWAVGNTDPSGELNLTGVRGIGPSAFSGCSGLTSVTIPDGVTSIGDGAFSYCSGLTSVTIPDGVTIIGDWAFEGCDALTSVTIPDSVTNIGDSTFGWCSGLTGVTIPDSVTSIGDYAFQSCSGLTNVVIGSGVTSIGDSAFSGCSGLTSVTIPDSVTSIGYWAFGDCNELRDVVVPQCVCTNSCGMSSVFSCEWITNVVISGSVTDIGEYAFSGCSGLTSVTIPNSVTNIGDGAFEWCENLATVTILSGVMGIDPEAFAYCPSLTSFEVSENNLAYKSESGLLLTKDGMTLVAVPGALSSVTIPEGVVDVGLGALAGSQCQRLAIPSSLAEGIDEMLYALQNLRSFEVAAENRVLASCSGLLLTKNGETLLAVPPGLEGSVTVPDGVVNIGEYAFAGMRSHTCVTIPESVTNISFMAFGGIEYCCTVPDPSVITNIVFLGNAPIVEDGAFDMSDGSVAYVRRGSTGWGVEIPGLWQGMRLEYLDEGPQPIFTIENGVLTAVDLNGATEVAIPDRVTSIGEFAFYDCTNLSSVTIGTSLMNLHPYAFCRCGGLMSITVAEENPCYKSVNGLLLTKDGKTLVQGVNGGVVIPDEVTCIGDSAFWGCSGLTDVTISDSVTNIGAGAFSSCSGLTNVVIGCGVTDIGEYAFSGCSGLTSVTIPNSVTNIGEGAFSGCSGLTSVTIPNSVTDIGSVAFDGCSGLRSVTIPASTMNIGEGVFSGCSGLKSLVVADENPAYKVDSGLLLTKDGTTLVQGFNGDVLIPDGVMRIGNYAFWNCDGLTSVKLPDSVAHIGRSAFSWCTSLTSVTIPAGVTNLEYSAFGNCIGLTGISFLGDMPALVDSMFIWALDYIDVVFYVTSTWSGPTDEWDAIGYPVRMVSDTVATVNGASVTVPDTWLVRNPALLRAWNCDFDAMLKSTASNGTRSLAECYVLGLDPEIATNDFKITSFPLKADGTPDVEHIVFDPPQAKWNVPATYKVKGAANLNATEWPEVTEGNKADFRFFKVEVVLP